MPRSQTGQRVLRTCAVDHSCAIMGMIHECPQTPTECTEIKHIISIRRVLDSHSTRRRAH
jgi:hypothetical protein